MKIKNKTSPEIINYANNISKNLLSQKARSECEKYYALFKEWQQEKRTNSSKNALTAFAIIFSSSRRILFFAKSNKCSKSISFFNYRI